MESRRRHILTPSHIGFVKGNDVPVDVAASVRFVYNDAGVPKSLLPIWHLIEFSRSTSVRIRKGVEGTPLHVCFMSIRPREIVGKTHWIG